MRHNPRLHGLQFFLFLVLGLEVADDGLLASPALAAGFTCLPLLVQVVWSWLSCLLPRTTIPFVDWLFRKTTGCQFLSPGPPLPSAGSQTLNWMHPGLSLALHLLLRGEVIAAFAGLWHAEPLRASDRLLVPCFNQTFLGPGRWALCSLFLQWQPSRLVSMLRHPIFARLWPIREILSQQSPACTLHGTRSGPVLRSEAYWRLNRFLRLGDVGHYQNSTTAEGTRVTHWRQYRGLRRVYAGRYKAPCTGFSL